MSMSIYIYYPIFANRATVTFGRKRIPIYTWHHDTTTQLCLPIIYSKIRDPETNSRETDWHYCLSRIRNAREPDIPYQGLTQPPHILPVGCGLTSIFVSFRCTCKFNCRIKCFYINLPFEVCWIPFLLVLKPRIVLFIYSTSKMPRNTRTLRFKNYVNSGRC